MAASPVRGHAFRRVVQSSSSHPLSTATTPAGRHYWQCQSLLLRSSNADCSIDTHPLFVLGILNAFRLYQNEEFLGGDPSSCRARLSTLLWPQSDWPDWWSDLAEDARTTMWQQRSSTHSTTQAVHSSRYVRCREPSSLVYAFLSSQGAVGRPVIHWPFASSSIPPPFPNNSWTPNWQKHSKFAIERLFLLTRRTRGWSASFFRSSSYGAARPVWSSNIESWKKTKNSNQFISIGKRTFESPSKSAIMAIPNLSTGRAMSWAMRFSLNTEGMRISTTTNIGQWEVRTETDVRRDRCDALLQAQKVSICFKSLPMSSVTLWVWNIRINRRRSWLPVSLALKSGGTRIERSLAVFKGYTPNFTLQEDDIRAIQALYGKRPV